MSEEFFFDVKKKRPEELYEGVSDYYKGEVLENYAKSKSIMRIQEKIMIRALELISPLKKRSLILDAGCGPGFSAIYLKEIGFRVVAIDLLLEFLYYYDLKDQNPIASDMCAFPFRPNCFDALMSISALQWIFRDLNNSIMEKNLVNLAKSMAIILKPNSKAVFHFYPKNDILMKKIGKIFADKGNFSGNYIIDNYDNPVKRKIYLLLQKD